MSAAEARRVAGVDGCRGGWIVAEGTVRGPADLRIWLTADLSELVAMVNSTEIAIVAIDMPIGLSDGGPRPCDVAARRLLGRRGSTVFPTPPRVSLSHRSDWPAALAAARIANGGPGISKQAFHLLPKIEQAERLTRQVEPLRIYESHPELAFLRLAGESVVSKHTLAGQQQRALLLEAALGFSLSTVPTPRPHATAMFKRDDLLDALSLLITARHLHWGTAICLGGEPDGTGLLMSVAY